MNLIVLVTVSMLVASTAFAQEQTGAPQTTGATRRQFRLIRGYRGIESLYRAHGWL